MPALDLAKAQVNAVPHVVDSVCQSCRKCALAASAVARRSCRSMRVSRRPSTANLCYGCHEFVPTCPQGAIVLNGRE